MRTILGIGPDREMGLGQPSLAPTGQGPRLNGFGPMQMCPGPNSPGPNHWVQAQTGPGPNGPVPSKELKDIIFCSRVGGGPGKTVAVRLDPENIQTANNSPQSCFPSLCSTLVLDGPGPVWAHYAQGPFGPRARLGPGAVCAQDLFGSRAHCAQGPSGSGGAGAHGPRGPMGPWPHGPMCP